VIRRDRDNVFQLCQPETSDPLTEALRNGARALLSQAVEAEVAALLDCHVDKLTDDGRRRLVRQGHLPEREIMTGVGPVAVQLAPRLAPDARAFAAIIAGGGRIIIIETFAPGQQPNHRPPLLGRRSGSIRRDLATKMAGLAIAVPRSLAFSQQITRRLLAHE
jgi:hypothetical protein